MTVQPGLCRTWSKPKLLVFSRTGSKSILLWWFFLFYVLVFKIFLCCWRLMYVCIFLVKVTEWPPIGKIAAHSGYEMFSWYKYLIVSLVFSHFGFWSGSLFLIAPFPDLCLLVLSYHECSVNISEC